MYEQKTGKPLERGRVFMQLGELTVSRRHGGADSVVNVVTDRRIAMLGNALTATRDGNRLTMVLVVAPRTKKNSTTLGVRQSPQYRAYRDWIVRAIAGVQTQLALPLPPRPHVFNLAARYYVDRYGHSADLFGLHDGLADALQQAQVVENDWQFRTSDGSRVILGDPEPRVELTITPLPPDPAEAP